MMNVERTIENLRKRGFTVSYFDTAAQALAYLDQSIDQTTVGVGGSVTLRDMGTYEALSSHNQVFWQWYDPEGADREITYRRGAEAEVYPPSTPLPKPASSSILTAQATGSPPRFTAISNCISWPV